MSLCAKALNKSCIEAIRRIIDRLPDRVLASLAKSEPQLKNGGFGLRDLSALRVKLLQLVCGASPVSPELRQTLAMHSLSETITGRLSLRTLEALRLPFFSLSGWGDFVVAGLLDGRPDVRAAAERWLADGEPETLPDPSGAAVELRNFFAELSGLMSDGGHDSPEDDLRRIVRELKTRMRDAELAEERARGMRRELDAETRKRQEFQSEAEVLKSRLITAERLAREAAAALESERQQRAGLVRARTEAVLARELSAAVPPDNAVVETALAERGQLSAAAGLLSDSLVKNLPLGLLLDGHNVFFGMDSRYNPPRGVSRSDEEKRALLVKDVVDLLAPSPAVRGLVVFDGARPSDRECSVNVREIYSGGQGEHRADRVLLECIDNMRAADPGLNLLLVSDDGKLCGAARRKGAKTLTVEELRGFYPALSGRR
ncbi:MAG: hypothetical protein IJU44_02145 [Kiritimatiellae bacterium]|nr:hypothetical protein [Kiritimatiellia bacterium]